MVPTLIDLFCSSAHIALLISIKHLPAPAASYSVTDSLPTSQHVDLAPSRLRTMMFTRVVVRVPPVRLAFLLKHLVWP